MPAKEAEGTVPQKLKKDLSGKENSGGYAFAEDEQRSLHFLWSTYTYVWKYYFNKFINSITIILHIWASYECKWNLWTPAASMRYYKYLERHRYHYDVDLHGESLVISAFPSCQFCPSRLAQYQPQGALYLYSLWDSQAGTGLSHDIISWGSWRGPSLHKSRMWNFSSEDITFMKSTRQNNRGLPSAPFSCRPFPEWFL